MKLLICMDMEGISGVSRWEHVTPGHAEYERFRRIMTADVNAAIAGAFAAGVEDVVVSDGHWDGQNVLIEELDPRARLNSGNSAPLAMVQGADTKPDAAFLIGYHARAGAHPAVLDHTWSSVRVADLMINGRVSGESGLNGSVLGYFGVPVLLVSGDQTATAEAADWMPGIETAVVKNATSRTSADCLPIETAQAVIREKAELAVRRFLQGQAPQPVKTVAPVKMSVRFNTSAQADGAEVTPNAVRADGRTIEFESADMLEAYFMFRSVVGMANR